MTLRDLIRRLQEIEPTCGELHVFYDEQSIWVNLSGVEVREMKCGPDWSRYVALTGHAHTEELPARPSPATGRR